MSAFTMIWLDMFDNLVQLWENAINFMPEPREK